MKYTLQEFVRVANEFHNVSFSESAWEPIYEDYFVGAYTWDYTPQIIITQYSSDSLESEY